MRGLELSVAIRGQVQMHLQQMNLWRRTRHKTKGPKRRHRGDFIVLQHLLKNILPVLAGTGT